MENLLCKNPQVLRSVPHVRVLCLSVTRIRAAWFVLVRAMWETNALLVHPSPPGLKTEGFMPQSSPHERRDASCVKTEPWLGEIVGSESTRSAFQLYLIQGTSLVRNISLPSPSASSKRSKHSNADKRAKSWSSPRKTASKSSSTGSRHHKSRNSPALSKEAPLTPALSGLLRLVSSVLHLSSWSSLPQCCWLCGHTYMHS